MNVCNWESRDKVFPVYNESQKAVFCLSLFNNCSYSMCQTKLTGMFQARKIKMECVKPAEEWHLICMTSHKEQPAVLPRLKFIGTL